MAPSGEQGTWKALGELSSIGLTLVVATVIGLVAGYYADRWLGTKPWLLLIGLGLGIAAGFVNLFRSVTRAERDLDDSRASASGPNPIACRLRPRFHPWPAGGKGVTNS